MLFAMEMQVHYCVHLRCIMFLFQIRSLITTCTNTIRYTLSIYMCSPCTGVHCIMNSNNDQLPVSLVAYMVDRALHQYAGSWIQNSLKPGFFPGFLFVTAFTSDYTCTTIKVQSMTVNVTHEYQERQH